MTTLAVDDELYRLAREAAAAEGKTVEEYVGSVLRQFLSPPKLQQTTRNGLPVMVLSEPAPRIDPGRIRRLIEEEGF